MAGFTEMMIAQELDIAHVHGADPVVGWLVCVTGPNTGRDYRLFARINTIGRAEKNDVCLKGDNTISIKNPRGWCPDIDGMTIN